MVCPIRKITNAIKNFPETRGHENSLTMTTSLVLG